MESNITFTKVYKNKRSKCGTFYVNRSRPVVRVNAEVQLENGDETPENSNGAVIIDSENRTCSLASGIKVACLVVKGCLLYEGEAVDDELGNLAIRRFYPNMLLWSYLFTSKTY